MNQVKLLWKKLPLVYRITHIIENSIITITIDKYRSIYEEGWYFKVKPLRLQIKEVNIELKVEARNGFCFKLIKKFLFYQKNIQSVSFYGDHVFENFHHLIRFFLERNSLLRKLKLSTEFLKKLSGTAKNKIIQEYKFKEVLYLKNEQRGEEVICGQPWVRTPPRYDIERTQRNIFFRARLPYFFYCIKKHPEFSLVNMQILELTCASSMYVKTIYSLMELTKSKKLEILYLSIPVACGHKEFGMLCSLIRKMINSFKLRVLLLPWSFWESSGSLL
eukprot:snap_masked-scaffold_13-processed-gene-6.40-mRNA-1 protein AED:1.00 eAED:1.00 QI:0/0/0/0/1/1/2/0/275